MHVGGDSRQLVVVRIAWKREAHERGNKEKQRCQATMRSEDPLAVMGNCTFLFRAETDCGINVELLSELEYKHWVACLRAHGSCVCGSILFF
jgi:hypothetical protein